MRLQPHSKMLAPSKSLKDFRLRLDTEDYQRRAADQIPISDFISEECRIYKCIFLHFYLAFISVIHHSCARVLFGPQRYNIKLDFSYSLKLWELQNAIFTVKCLSEALFRCRYHTPSNCSAYVITSKNEDFLKFESYKSRIHIFRGVIIIKTIFSKSPVSFMSLSPILIF